MFVVCHVGGYVRSIHSKTDTCRNYNGIVSKTVHRRQPLERNNVKIDLNSQKKITCIPHSNRNRPAPASSICGYR
jgi:hypothetical protein